MQAKAWRQSVTTPTAPLTASVSVTGVDTSNLWACQSFSTRADDRDARSSSEMRRGPESTVPSSTFCCRVVAGNRHCVYGGEHRGRVVVVWGDDETPR